MRNAIARLAPIILLSGCSTSAIQRIRTPASILEAKSFEETYKLFSGPLTPQEQVVAKSLPNAPLRVELSEVDPRISCSDSIDGKKKTSFLLPPQRSGKYEYVKCSVDHNGSTYPDKLELTVKYNVLLDELTLPESEYASKKRLVSYQKMLSEGQDWSQDFRAYIDQVIETKIVQIDMKSSGPTFILEGAPEGGEYYLNIEAYSGELIQSAGFKKNNYSVQGKEKNPATLYPAYNELSLVCGFGLSNEQVSNVAVGGGELFKSSKASGSLFCQINKKKGSKDEKKFGGDFRVHVKAISHAKLAVLLENYLASEETHLLDLTKTYHKNEVNQLKSDNSEIKISIASFERSLPSIRAQIDRQNLLDLKEKTISALFPTPLSGTVSRAASAIKVTPVKKTVYDENGEKSVFTYLSITNSISYKIEASDLVEKVDRELPFEERVNLYLATSTPFKADGQPTLITVCEDKIDEFYKVLGRIQSDSNIATKPLESILRDLKGPGVGSISGCKSTNKNRENISFARGKGNKDYVIHWKKVNERELEATNVGALYTGHVLGEEIKAIVLKDRSSSHPVFKPGVKLPYNKSLHEKSWQGDKGAYVLEYSDEQFIKPVP